MYVDWPDPVHLDNMTGLAADMSIFRFWIIDISWLCEEFDNVMTCIVINTSRYLACVQG